MNITNDDNPEYNNMCPICYENIDLNKQDSYIILDCCEQHVHLDCIINWNKSNFVKDIKCSTELCIMCRQENDFLYDIAQYINPIRPNQDISNTLANTSTIIPDEDVEANIYDNSQNIEHHYTDSDNVAEYEFVSDNRTCNWWTVVKRGSICIITGIAFILVPILVCLGL